LERVAQGASQRKCCTVGKFEAFHIGHQKLIEKAKSLCSSVLVVSIDKDRLGLFTSQERESLARTLGVKLLNLEFERVKNQTPEQFFAFLKSLGCTTLVVGEDWRFGRNRAGDVNLATQLGRIVGIEVFTVSAVALEGEKVATTKVVSLISAGEVRRATELLGFPYFCLGKVEAGRQFGRRIGYPTLNIGCFKKLLLPNGVYEVRLWLKGKSYMAVANLGVKPTFGAVERTLEVHIPDAELPELYGEEVKVEFLSFLRKEMAFSSTKELAKQIQADIERVKLLWRSSLGRAKV